MSLKEEIYHAIEEHIRHRVDNIERAKKLGENTDSDSGALLELLRIQYLIYKKFYDYNQKLIDDPPQER